MCEGTGPSVEGSPPNIQVGLVPPQPPSGCFQGSYESMVSIPEEVIWKLAVMVFRGGGEGVARDTEKHSGNRVSSSRRGVQFFKGPSNGEPRILCGAVKTNHTKG